MTRFLFDANLSPETARYLATTFGSDVLDLVGHRLGHLTDGAMVALAQQEQRVIITLDKDFGELYHRRARGQLGVIILRLRDKSIESVNEVLGRFFLSQANEIPWGSSLVVIDEKRVRIRSES